MRDMEDIFKEKYVEWVKIINPTIDDDLWKKIATDLQENDALPEDVANELIAFLNAK